MNMATGVTPPPGASLAAEGDTLESLLVPLLGSAYRTALRLTRDAADAEDLVQDAAVQASRGFGTFQPGTNFRGWFFRILTNCFYSRYRKSRREGIQVELEDAPELHLYSQTAAIGLHAETEPAAALMDRLDAEAVAQAIDALPDEYRVVAALYFLQDFPYLEIARILDVPIGTVRSRLHRGRRLLQQKLWTIAEDRGIVKALRRKEAKNG
jgi:RNA polymerase sigma-70 factor (ECF subfamily)